MLLAILVLAAGAVLFARWPALRPRNVEVGATTVVSRDDVLAKAAIDPGVNIWLQNTGAMRQRIETIPYVKEAFITRVPPADVHITIVERAPYAVLVSGTMQALADHDLRVLGPVQPNDATLPRFTLAQPLPGGPGTFVTDSATLSLRADNDALAAAHVDAATLAHDTYGDLIVTLHNGIRVLFGEERELTKTIPLVKPILDQVGRKGRPIDAIDLRAAATPVVVYKK
jgi:cell division protein FtsQ